MSFFWLWPSCLLLTKTLWLHLTHWIILDNLPILRSSVESHWQSCFCLVEIACSLVSAIRTWTSWEEGECFSIYYTWLDFPDGASGKEPAYRCRRWKRRGFDPWVGKIPWRRAQWPTPVFCLENPLDRGSWWATVHGVAESRTQLKQLRTQSCCSQMSQRNNVLNIAFS